MFSILKNCQTIFHISCTILHCHQPCMRAPVSPHPYQHFLFSVFFFIIAILVSVKWFFIVVLICISLLTHDIEPLFVCFLSICISSLEKCLSKSFAHLKIGLFAFLLLSCKSSLYILDTRPLSDIWFASIFSHTLDCLFTLLRIFFDAQKL